MKVKKIEYSAENYISVPQAADQMIKEKKENEIQYLETAVEFYSKDFKTIKNIEDEKPKDLFKAATKSNEGMGINDKITIKDCTIDDENNKTLKFNPMQKNILMIF